MKVKLPNQVCVQWHVQHGFRFSTDFLTLEIAFSCCIQAKENLTFNSSPSNVPETLDRLIFIYLVPLAVHNYIQEHTYKFHTHTDKHFIRHSVIRVSTYSHTIRFCKMKIFLNVSLFVRLQQVILLISKMLHDISSHGNRFDYNSYTNIKLKRTKVKKRNLLFPRISW